VVHTLSSLTSGCFKETCESERAFLEQSFSEKQLKSMMRFAETDPTDYVLASIVIDKLLDFADSVGVISSDMQRYKTKQFASATHGYSRSTGSRFDFSREMVDRATQACEEHTTRATSRASRKKSAVETCFRSPGERKTSAAMTDDPAERKDFNERLQAFMECEEMNGTTAEEPVSGWQRASFGSEPGTRGCIPAGAVAREERLAQLDALLRTVKTGVAVALPVLKTLPSEAVACDVFWDFKGACDASPVRALRPASPTTCLRFLALLAVEAKRLHRLPWFSYFRPSDADMALMLPTWFSDRAQDAQADWDSDRLVAQAAAALQQRFDADQKVSMADDDVARLGNDLGDALCLAVACQLWRACQILSANFGHHLAPRELPTVMDSQDAGAVAAAFLFYPLNSGCNPRHLVR